MREALDQARPAAASAAGQIAPDLAEADIDVVADLALDVGLDGGHRGYRPIVGVNIGKTKVVPEEGAIADYVTSARLVADVADYVVVNVSSPNTPGLRDLQSVDKLRPLLAAVRSALDQASPRRRVPLLVKIAPDLADADIDAVADLALDLGLDGIIATNTTISRDGLRDSAAVADAGPGGLSGAPLKARALAVLRRLHARAGDRLVLIAAGGIETADDARDRLAAGATLLQAYTAFIYEGPCWPGRVQRGLAARIRAASTGLGRAAVARVSCGSARTSLRPDQRCYVPVKGGREVLT